MAEDPYVTGPKNDTLKQPKDEMPEAPKSKRKWHDILTDAMIPGKWQKGMIDRSRKQIDEATKK